MAELNREPIESYDVCGTGRPPKCTKCTKNGIPYSIIMGNDPYALAHYQDAENVRKITLFISIFLFLLMLLNIFLTILKYFH